MHGNKLYNEELERHEAALVANVNESNRLFTNVTSLATSMHEYLKVHPSCFWAYDCWRASSSVSGLVFNCNTSSFHEFDFYNVSLAHYNERKVELVQKHDISKLVRIAANKTCDAVCSDILYYSLFYFVIYQSHLLFFSMCSSLCFVFLSTCPFHFAKPVVKEYIKPDFLRDFHIDQHDEILDRITQSKDSPTQLRQRHVVNGVNGQFF